jgi:hypothetical protein
MEKRKTTLRGLLVGLTLMSHAPLYGQDPASQSQIQQLNQQIFQLQLEQNQQQIEQRQRETQQQQSQQQQLYQLQQRQQLQRQQDQLLQLQSLRQQPSLQAGAPPLPLSESATQANITTWDQLVSYVQYVSDINKLNGEIANAYARAKTGLAVPQDTMTRLRELKTGLLVGIESYRNNTGASAAALTGSINALCNLMLALVPAGSPAFPMESLRESLDQSLVNGKFDLNTITNTFASAAIADKAGAAKDWLASIVALQELAERTATGVATDRVAASDAITQQLELIEQQMTMYGNAVQQAEILSRARQAMESAIAAYLDVRADVLFTAPPIAQPNGASGNSP